MLVGDANVEGDGKNPSEVGSVGLVRSVVSLEEVLGDRRRLGRSRDGSVSVDVGWEIGGGRRNSILVRCWD